MHVIVVISKMSSKEILKKGILNLVGAWLENCQEKGKVHTGYLGQKNTGLGLR